MRGNEEESRGKKECKLKQVDKNHSESHHRKHALKVTAYMYSVQSLLKYCCCYDNTPLTHMSVER